MNFMTAVRPIAECSSLDQRRYENTSEELRVDPVEKKLPQQKQRRLNHVNRMEDVRYQKQLLDSRPVGKRRPGRSLKRPLDGYNREAEVGHILA